MVFIYLLKINNSVFCVAKDKTSDGAASSRAAGPGAAAAGSRRLLGGIRAAARGGGAAAADGDAAPLLVAAAQPGRGRRPRRHSVFASVVVARLARPLTKRPRRRGIF